MAQLKDTTVTGNLRVTGDIYTNDLQVFSGKTANYIFAAPNGSNGAPTWRQLVAADLPTATSSAKGIIQVGTGLNVNAGTISVVYGSSAGAALATNGSAGTASSAARSDHTHPYPTAAQVGAIASGTTLTNVAISANITTNADYPIVFATSNKDTTAAKNEGLQKSGAKFYFNPNSGNIQATKFNGYTLAAASEKGVDTSIAASSTSTNLPTSQAVATFVEGKGYLTSHQTINQDGLTGATINRYGTCNTGATSPTKTVSITNGTVPTLGNTAAGLKITVKFTNANTADNPTLNVNNKGDKAIYHRGAKITTGSNKALLAGVCDFIFDGNQWHLVGNYYDTTYSSKAAASGGGAVSLVTTGEKYTWNNKQNALTFDGTYSSSNKVATVSTVTSAINALDGSITGEGGTTKTITSLSQTNGKVSATFENIQFPVTSVCGKTGAITIGDLGLSSALKYVGSEETLPNAADVYSTYNNGDVITVAYKEYAYIKGEDAASSSWVELGDEGSYKLKQTAVSDPSVPTTGTTTATEFIDTISQDASGVITPTKKKLPEASSSVKGIVGLGASGGAATYEHTHDLSIATDTGTSSLTLAANTKYKLTAGGSTYIFTTQNDAAKLNQSSLNGITSLNDFIDSSALIYTSKGGGNTIEGKPTGVSAFGVLSFKTADGWYGQLLMSSNTSSGLYWRTATTLSDGWKTLLDSNNTAAGTNNNATLEWSTTYTIAKINGTDIKFTTMVKPTYSDVGAAPAVDGGYLPLSGGIMTGNIRRYYSTASTEPMITALSKNLDIYLWQVGHGDAVGTNLTNNGYKLLYKGTNDSTNNYLQLIATKADGTETIAMQLDELGNANYKGEAHFNLGTSNTSTNYRKFTIQGESSNKMSIGPTGIQVYNSSNAAQTLYFQAYGGNIIVGADSYKTATRTMHGVYTFPSSATAFNFSGIGAASDNISRNIWFSYNGQRGTPVYDDDFKYNPSTNVMTIGKLTVTGGTADSSLSTSGALTISSGSSKATTINSGYTLYLNSPSSTSIIFTKNVADPNHEMARFDLSSNFVPKSGLNNTIGTSSLRWHTVYATTFDGDLNGNASTADALSADASNTTEVFYRGDNTWSNTLKQKTSAVLGIANSNLRIGQARRDLNFDVTNGSGTALNDGNASGITWGAGEEAYAGIYYQTSGSYGSRLLFGTTSSYTNGVYGRVIIDHLGNVGIGKMLPTTKLDIASTVGVGGTSNPNGIINIVTSATINANQYAWGIKHLATNLQANGDTCFITGKDTSTSNSAVFGYRYAGNDSDNNAIIIGFYTDPDKLKIYKSGLEVNGNGMFNGKISFAISSAEKAYMTYNSTDNSIDFMFA